MEQEIKLLLYKVIQVLEKLDKDNRELHASHLSIIREGITPYYHQLYEELSPNDSVITDTIASVVDETLNMYAHINKSLKVLSFDQQRSLLSYEYLFFKGYHATHDDEWLHQMYSKYLIRDFKDIPDGLDTSSFNFEGTHQLMRAEYQRMLIQYKRIAQKFTLSYEEIISILSASEASICAC